MRVGGGAAGAGRGPAFYDGSGSAVWAPAAPASRAVTQQATAWPARRRFSAIEIQYNDMIRPRRFQNQNNLFLNKTAECGRARRWRGGWRWSRACPSSSRPSRRPPTARRGRLVGDREAPAVFHVFSSTCVCVCVPFIFSSQPTARRGRPAVFS